jgi:uncharacterized protein YoxC
MNNFSKAYWNTSGTNISFRMPISKIDVEKRIVSGWATTDSVDRQNDIITSDASSKAFEAFRGNVREQHTPLAVGKVTDFRQDKYYNDNENKFYNGVYVDVYVSKGAEDTWHKIQEGILTGFSIGGSILDSEVEKIDGYDKPVRVVKEYELHELSLVDNPANPNSNIVSIQKINSENVQKNYLENVFYSPEEDLIILSEKADMQSPNTGKVMHNIGFVETNDSEKEITVSEIVKGYKNKKKKMNGDDKKMKHEMEEEDVDKMGHKDKKKKMSHEEEEDMDKMGHKDKKKKMSHEDEDMDKATNLKTGDFVSWGSSGGTARGKITRIVRTGSVKVPGSSFTINATEDNPAVLIRVYRKGKDGYKPSDTIVGHKMSTLRRISALTKISDGETVDSNILKSIVNFIKKEAINLSNKENTEEIVKSEDDVVATEDFIDETVLFDEQVDQDTPVAEETVSEEAVAVEKSEDVKEEVASTPKPASEDLIKSVEEIKASVDGIANDLTATVNSLRESIAELTKSISEVTKEVTGVKENVEEFGKRVDAVEADTAVRKSGDLGEVAQEPKIKKSVWEGRFLSSADLYR